MQNLALDTILLESRIRYENRLAAIKLGFFDQKKLAEFDDEQERLVTEECERLKSSASV